MDLEGLNFTKMSAAGNDFILINNFSYSIKPEQGSLLAFKLCRRAISVGADGLILLEPPRSKEAQFSWRFFNADGSEAEMCGNGGRCAALFAVQEGLAKSPLAFDTLAGLVKAYIKEPYVKIQLTPPRDLTLDIRIDLSSQTLKVSFINTGVPHVVIFWEGIEKAPVEDLGPKLRHHPRFSPEGTNVNFVEIRKNKLLVRTYERGVEAETLACGTGAVASAIIASIKGFISPPVTVKTSGGEELKVFFSIFGNSAKEVYLEGPVRKIYRASLYKGALD